jgi:hypothetical protein
MPAAPPTTACPLAASSGGGGGGGSGNSGGGGGGTGAGGSTSSITVISPNDVVDASVNASEPFSSCDLAGRKDVDGLGELPGLPG